MALTIDTKKKVEYTDVLGKWDTYHTGVQTEQETKQAVILGQIVQQLVREGFVGDPTQKVHAKAKVLKNKVTIEVKA